MISYCSYVRIVLPELGPLVGIKFVEVFHVTELFKSHRKVHVLSSGWFTIHRYAYKFIIRGWLLRGPPFHFSDSTHIKVFSLKGFLEKIKIRLRAGSRRYGFDQSVSSSAGKYVALNKASLPEVYKWSGTAWLLFWNESIWGNITMS